MPFIFSAKRVVFLFVGMHLFFTSFASEHKKEKAFDVTETIMHHISDAHEWHLWGGHDDGKSIYLPVILIDGGLKTFSSSCFYHGKLVSFNDVKTQKEGHYAVGVGPATGYALYDEEIYKLGTNGLLTVKGGEVIGSEAPFDLSITKNVLSLFIGAFLILVLMAATARHYKKNGAVAPKGLSKFMEPMILMVRDLAIENIGEKKYMRYLPFLTTIFFFIWINNMLGLIPIFPGGANLTGNISITLTLAVMTLLMTVLSGNANYWKHIFATPGVPVALLPIMIPIELVGILTKPFALMIRLFANMTAGHVIVLALISIIFINQSAAWGGLSVPMALFISVLELLVAFLQGYLFTLLSALFIGAAVEEAHH